VALRKKRSLRREYNSNYLLSGLLYCGKCGAKMRYQKWGKDGTKIYCYSRQTSKKNLIKDPNCDNERVDAAEVEAAVINDMLSLSVKHSENGVKAKKVDIIKEYEGKMNEVQQKIKRLYNLYATDGNEILLATINENKEELENIMKRLDFEREKQKKASANHKKHKLIEKIADGWDMMSNDERQKLVREIINKVVLTDGRVDIYYNF
jgi:site-specific DNA recombinase